MNKKHLKFNIGTKLVASILAQTVIETRVFEVSWSDTSETQEIRTRNKMSQKVNSTFFYLIAPSALKATPT